MSDECEDYDNYEDYDGDDFYLDNRCHLAVDDVPWKRKGIPDFRGNGYKGKWKPEVANASPKYKSRLVADKLLIEKKMECCYNYIEERSFAMFWDYENNDGTNCALYNIIDDPEISGRIETDKERKLVEYTAQSIIQWLGTNIGSCFIDRVRQYAKKHSEKIKKKINPQHVIDEKIWKEMREERREEIKEKVDKNGEGYREKLIRLGTLKGNTNVSRD